MVFYQSLYRLHHIAAHGDSLVCAQTGEYLAVRSGKAADHPDRVIAVVVLFELTSDEIPEIPVHQFSGIRFRIVGNHQRGDRAEVTGRTVRFVDIRHDCLI